MASEAGQDTVQPSSLPGLGSPNKTDVLAKFPNLRPFPCMSCLKALCDWTPGDGEPPICLKDCKLSARPAWLGWETRCLLTRRSGVFLPAVVAGKYDLQEASRL